MDRKCERFRPLVLRLSELDIATIAPHATTDRDAALAFCLLLDQMPRNLYRQDTDPEGLGRICFGSVSGARGSLDADGADGRIRSHGRWSSNTSSPRASTSPTVGIT